MTQGLRKRPSPSTMVSIAAFETLKALDDFHTESEDREIQAPSQLGAVDMTSEILSFQQKPSSKFMPLYCKSFRQYDRVSSSTLKQNSVECEHNENQNIGHI